ncbi:MAG TPA: hypothetical protein VES19_02925 [Candidatus Limnocylindrales bacterium]|nr:hypothetical protein [Candidatus Limnocylindrales bacterium]
MRRTRLVQLVGTTLLAAALLVPSSAMAATVQPAAPGAGQPAVAAPILAEIKLGCSLALLNPLGPATPHRAAVCKWTAPAGITIAKYRVWRSVDSRARRLMSTVTTLNPLRFVDRYVFANHRYTYTVVGFAADGTRVAVSQRATIQTGRAIQVIGMRCGVTAIADGKAVSCRWAATTRPAVVRYVLIRSVDGAAREAIYRTARNGIRSFVDTKVASGQTLRYAVLGLSSTGRVLSRGGPIVVQVP